MTKQRMYEIAKRNLKEAEINFKHNFNRKGITLEEREALTEKVEFYRIVCNMILGESMN